MERRRIPPWSRGIKVALAIFCSLYLLVALMTLVSAPGIVPIIFVVTALGLSAFSYAGYRRQKADNP